MRNEDILVFIIIVVLVIFLFSGFFGFGNMGGMMGGFEFGGMWIFGFLFMTLILVALILFILWLVKQLQNDNRKK